MIVGAMQEWKPCDCPVDVWQFVCTT